MTYFSALHQPHVIAENQRFVRARFLDCFAYARNDVKCAALSLAALNDFVCEANGTNIHLVKAMPQAAQEASACFSLLVRFLFFLRNKKEKMNNNLHNLCMCSIDAHIMGYVINYVTCTIVRSDFW